MAKKRAKKNDLPEGAVLLVRNKRARHDYEITETYEAGLVLLGSEVKSLRAGQASIAEAYVHVRSGEAFLIGANIKEYPWSNNQNHDPTRDRKLLLHGREIAKIATKVEQKGFSLVPMQLYLKSGKIKLQFGVGRGKRLYEKRESKREQEAEREMDRARKR